jgi:hypothetical protein
MIDHVSTRCGAFRLLFPTRNIEAIVPLNPPARITPLAVSHRRPPNPIAVDLRQLLHPKGAQETPSCIRLDWVSTDTERRAILIVDSVDEIVNSPHGQLERRPLLPHRVLNLCDGLLHDPDGTYRISVHLDVQWPMTPLSEARLWRKALVTLEENNGTVGAPLTSPA